MVPRSAAGRSSPAVFDPGGGLWSISELNARIKGVVEGGFPEVGVWGEISELSRPASGHLYLELKDNGARLSAVIWRSTAERLRFELEKGLEVRAWGAIQVYAPRGVYQLNIRRIEPAGVGVRELAFRQLYERLQREGLFDEARKRRLPRYPGRIVVVTSSTGDAVRDVIRVAGQRWPMAELLIVASRVQGDGAAEELVAALGRANRVADADLIVLARGGGSVEDLWTFNEEILVRAIAGSRLPVISAVGHERDVTLADLAADVRAPTPTAAAVLATPDREELAQTLDGLGLRMGRRLREVVDRIGTQLANLERRAELACRRTLERGAARTDSLELRLRMAMRRGLEGRQKRLGEAAARLDALSPLAVLARGYSLTQDVATGRVVRAAEQLKPGDRVRTRLASGSFLARVEAVEAPDAAGSW
ncbi:MAG: exodeoxyribonuclease 7 large subunit [Isosphaeraceae bacterium]|jgi:exodeoxyribonuclease VII large subunit|nr:MAG: exodeoxyribonuclease 7 large subunit [Isosphaeraceae bacterium]